MNTQLMLKPSLRKQGSALLTVLIVSFVVMIAGITLTRVSGNSALQVRKIHEGVSALSIAEAGIGDMMSRMSTNYTYWMNNSINASFGDGSYSVTSKTDKATGNVTITSTGTRGSETRTTSVELLGKATLPGFDFFTSGGTIISGGNTTLNTAALTINGNAHANKSVLHTNGHTTVNGDVSAVGVVQIPAVTAGHKMLPNSAPKVVPNFLPFDKWEAAAKAGGIYYPTSVDLAGIPLTPANGVVYVNGDITINNRSEIVGTLVASGSIIINNLFKQTPFNTNWPSLLAGINVHEFNRNDYYGIIFAGQNIISRNRRYVKGGLVALNDIDIDNSSTVDPLNSIPVTDPTNTNKPSPPEIIVGGWLK